MAKYFVNRNAQATGEHEVHKQGCPTPPEPPNQRYLGEFSNCFDAVRAARKVYTNVDGCSNCCRECHMR